MYRLLFCLLLCLNSSAGAAQILINEFLASNASVNSDNEYGAFSDWVELYNPGSNPVNLDGWHLSDSGDPLKWAFPSGTTISPGGFLLVWADDKNSGLHTNFKLSADGEGLTLSDPVGAIVDEITFEIQATDISQGRKTDGDPAWGYFTRPTPGATNAGTPFYDDFTFQAPVFNISGGFYDSPVTVEVKNLLGSGDLRYTIDGSAPISSSPIWGQPINISANTVVKARIFEQGRIPGPIITNTYFIGGDLLNRGLPVISLSTHPDYFFAPDSGLYVQSFKPDWEYPVHIEMYEPDGLLGFHHDAGVQIGGENAWILPEKLLNIYSRKQYGNAHFDYQLFPDDARTSFGDFILRTSGNDWSNTLFRDNMMQSLINAQADLDIQHFRHCIVFINGAYFGIHIITEKQDADYALEHHQIAGDSLDYIENNAEIKEGDAVAYQQMMSLADAGVQTDNQFQALEMLCDTKDYTDYIISQIFTANSSWGHNIGLFRKRAADGRFRWFPHDYDRGFDLANQQSYAMEWATATNGASWTNPPWATLLLRKMLENANYKDQFIRRFADHLYVTFHPSTINRRVEQLSGSLRNEIPYHVQRWAGTTSSYGNGIPSVNFWETEVAELKQFGTGRNAYMWSNLNTFFGLQGSSELTVQVSHTDHGYVRLHDIRIPSYPWAGKYFTERNFTLTAVPKPGFNFVQWEKTTDVLTELIPAGTNWKYHDQDTEPPITWNQNNFDDSVWASGNAPLGYGDGDESTTLNYGASASQKTISYYFRYEFDVINPAEFGGLTAKMIADDGAVAYLNGQEIWRQNMPAGAIGFQTLAASTLSDPGENEWITQNIPAQFLVQGANVLAVEVHQASQSSSDLSFDFELSGTINGQSTFLSSNPVLQTKLEGNPLVLRAVFEPNGNCGILPDTVQGMLTLTAACSPYHAYSDVVVKKGASLIVEPGVEILMPGQSNLWVHGRIEVNGTANAPVLIRSISEDEPWGAMLLKNTEDTARLSHLRIENATAGLHRFYFPAAISAYNADLQLDHLDLTAVKDNPIFSRFSAVSLTNSNLKSVVTGDCINVKKGYARVENCEFEGGFEPDMDAIDYDGVVGGIVRNNVIHGFRGDNCDGLDIGEACENLLIENNLIFHCFDKGISVGQQSSATIRNNTIAYTSYGIALKDQSPVIIDHCTLYGNQKGIAAYEKNPGHLGGIGVVSNCIVSNALLFSYEADTYSELDIIHCISDPDTVSGTGNLSADPRFVDPERYNFLLTPGSPAISAGINGVNIGAESTLAFTIQPELMIAEILYNDTLSTKGEFIEILNDGLLSVNLNGYTLANAIDFRFPSGAIIAPGERIVVAEDATQFGGNIQVFEWTDGKLKNEGESILLYDGAGLLVDWVRYDNHAPWPESSELNGKSIELRGPQLDNHLATSWQASNGVGGTPGFDPAHVGVYAPQNQVQFEVSPNPNNGVFYIDVKDYTSVSVRVCDLSGKIILPDRQVVSGHPVQLEVLAPGSYLLYLTNKHLNLPFVKLIQVIP